MEGGRGSTSAHHRAQSSLVIVQMTLTLVLLVGAGLLLRTIRHLWDVNPGFDPQPERHGPALTAQWNGVGKVRPMHSRESDEYARSVC
jgi:hypothetical protein